MERFLMTFPYLCKHTFLMRNRPDISYLTILGLSLTVVIAMQKGDSCEDSVRFKLSDADGHHICFLSVDAVRDAFLAVSHEKSSFVFVNNTPTYTALPSSIKVLVDVNSLRFRGAVTLGIDPDEPVKPKDTIPDNAGSFLASESSFNGIFATRFDLLQWNDLNTTLHLSAFPVRAGPEWII
jgi:hypothetical protein